MPRPILDEPRVRNEEAGVWATTADEIAEYYLANYYDEVKSWIAERNARAPH